MGPSLLHGILRLCLIPGSKLDILYPLKSGKFRPYSFVKQVSLGVTEEERDSWGYEVAAKQDGAQAIPEQKSLCFQENVLGFCSVQKGKLYQE